MSGKINVSVCRGHGLANALYSNFVIPVVPLIAHVSPLNAMQSVDSGTEKKTWGH